MMSEPVIAAVSPPEYMAGMRPEELEEQLAALLVFMALQGVNAGKKNGGKLTVAQFVNPSPFALIQVRDNVPVNVWQAAREIAHGYVQAALTMQRPAAAVGLDVLALIERVRDVFSVAGTGVRLGRKGGR